ncbi:MAG: transposase, is4-like protein [Labilithrix sp.]|nr:transposase, is4-like protein [Labilithrix sp.]
MLCLMRPGDRVPGEHPLRATKKLADTALASLSPVFGAMYAGTARPSIPPERPLKVCEQLD